MKKFNPIIPVEDDGLFIPEVGEWSEQKYNLIGAYCDLFTTSMKRKWDNLIYIDLFAAAGYARLRNTNRIVKSSSLIAMSLPFPFNRYIICEQDEECFNALKTRIERNHPQMDVRFVKGDSNTTVDEVVSHIPVPAKGNTVLTFCFVDPFSINLHFDTIKRLGSKYAMDFLILLAFGMDMKRNFEKYLEENNEKIARFVGNEQWRVDFLKKYALQPTSFAQYIASVYRENMKRLGYIEPVEFHEIRSTDKNLSLYHLAFFSKHPLGNAFWEKIKSYSTGQTSLF